MQIPSRRCPVGSRQIRYLQIPRHSPCPMQVLQNSLVLPNARPQPTQSEGLVNATIDSSFRSSRISLKGTRLGWPRLPESIASAGLDCKSERISEAAETLAAAPSDTSRSAMSQASHANRVRKEPPPAIVSLVRNLKPFADLRHLHALVKLHIRLRQLREYLINRVPFLFHLKEPSPGLRPDWILSLLMDHFWGRGAVRSGLLRYPCLRCTP